LVSCGKVFEIACEPLQHVTDLDLVNGDVVRRNLAGPMEVDAHNFTAIQPFKPVGAFAQESGGGRDRCIGLTRRRGRRECPRGGCERACFRRRRVQQLVDTRRTQAHRGGDLPHRQSLPMSRGDGGGTLAISCREPVCHHPKVLSNLLLPLKALAATVSDDHIRQDARLVLACLENWTP
jgi:hypothetical protein